MPNQQSDFKCEIVERLGVLSTDTKVGWRKEINLISYNNKEPMIDIRTWSPEGRMGKGVTLMKQHLPNS